MKPHRPETRDWLSAETRIVESLVDNWHEQNGFCIWPRVAIVCCDCSRGYAGETIYPGGYRKLLVVIPSWSLYRLPDYAYAYQYICHEFTHCIVGVKENHNSIFYAMYKRVTPPELWHLDSGYKPRNTKAAGISVKQIDNILSAKIDSGTLTTDDL